MTIACILCALTLMQAEPPKAAEPPAQQTANETRPIAPEFLAAIEKTEKSVDSLKSFTVTAKLVSKLVTTGVERDPELVSTSTQRLTMIRPEKALIEADWAQFGEPDERPYLRALLDGRNLTTAFVPLKLYSIHQGDEADDRLGQESIIASTLNGSGLDVFVQPEMARFVIGHTDEAKFIGEETAEGVMCRKFEAFFAGHRVVMWIGPEANPLLRKLTETREIAGPGGTKLTSSRTSILTWKTDEEIPAGTFRLELPAGAREVENVLDAVSAENTRTAVGSQMPDVTLKTLEGKDRKPAEWRGQARTIVFWATWMNAPETALKTVARMKAGSKPDENVILINVGEDADKIRAMLQAVPGLPECLIDPEEDLTLELHLKGVPSVVRVDAEGKVIEVRTGLPGTP